MDVASWLRSIGLEQYEAVFRENAIDLSVLPDLTDQDLQKLGVLLRPPPQITARDSKPRNDCEGSGIPARSALQQTFMRRLRTPPSAAKSQ